MIIIEMSCVQCKGTFTRERGKGARPFTTGSLCEKCVESNIKYEKAEVKAEASAELFEHEIKKHIKHKK